MWDRVVVEDSELLQENGEEKEMEVEPPPDEKKEDDETEPVLRGEGDVPNEEWRTRVKR